MSEEHRSWAEWGDLLLSVMKHDLFWRVRVEVQGDPDSAISDGTNYETSTRAQKAAVEIAHELFGTNVIEEELKWQSASSGHQQVLEEL